MRSRTKTFVIIGVVVVVAVLGSTAAIALTSSDSHAYRTATATRGTVTRQLHGTGVIEPVSQATVSFPVSGTVATVDVKLGQHVAIGATLATLNTTSLESTVLSKQATLAAAQLTLYKALHGEATSTGGSGSGGRERESLGRHHADDECGDDRSPHAVDVRWRASGDRGTA